MTSTSKSLLITLRTTQPRFVRLVLITSAIVSGTTSAIAQIQNLRTPTTTAFDFFYDADNNSLPASFTYFNLAATNNSAGGTVDLKLKGDWDYQLPRQARSCYVLTLTDMSFSVGNLLVEVSNLQTASNAKWVNGGGDSTTPAIHAVAHTNLFEPAPPNPDELSLPPCDSFVYDLAGNGYLTAPTAHAFDTSPYVLSANTTYAIEVYAETTIDDSAFNSGTPPVGLLTSLAARWGIRSLVSRVAFPGGPCPSPRPRHCS